jgi:3-oxoadipate enol-lactonase
MLSNSLGTNCGMWQPQISEFTKRYRVLRYDSRGHGRSAAPPGPYTIETLGRDALALLDALDLERVRFCGLSKGGMTGMWLGANAPRRLDRLVLCNTSARVGAPEAWTQRIDTVRKSGMAAIAPGVVDRWFTREFQQRAPDAVEQLRRMLLATAPEGYVASCAAIRDMNQSDTIAAIDLPVLVVVGGKDTATPPDHGAYIAKRVRRGRLVTLDAAHISNVEAADAFTSAVLRFLE